MILRLVFGLVPALVLLLQASDGQAAEYAGSATCEGCHRQATEAWRVSDHALAWRDPRPDTVLGAFDDRVFRYDGGVAHFSHEDGGYQIEITEMDRDTRVYRVHSVAGVRPLQQYLLETEGGRLQAYDIAWDVQRRRWFDLYPGQRLRPGDGMHWAGPYKNWNGRCAECHATGFRKNYDPRSRRYASIQAEKGVGCEACHGPGSNHLAWATRRLRDPQAEPPLAYGFSMDFRVGSDTAIQQCAGCHSRREPLGDGNPLPGTPFADAYRLALLVPGLYYADGQIQDEVYVYGSFLQSQMYAKGVSCMDCHDAHAATPKADGNALCTQCHSPAGNPRFPTLKRKIYDAPKHHFHRPGSSGAQCRNCHMLERVYMGVDRRRDHSFRIPRPDLAARTGAPDACTDCHSGRRPDWAAKEIERRYPDAARRPHYGILLAQGREDPVNTSEQLIAMALNARTAGIVRATALWLLGDGASGEAAGRVLQALNDPNPLVRAAAIGTMQDVSPQAKVQHILPLLDDPRRMVRIQAAKSMIAVPIVHLPEPAATHLQQAMEEWRASLNARSDFPETHMVIGGAALVLRNAAAAASAFREVVRMDPQQEDAWVMLVRVTAATAGPDATRKVLDAALTAIPESPTLRDMLRDLP